jgi:outer membrane protein TolC
LIGVQAIGLNYLFKNGSGIGSAGPAVSLPIFSGGRLQGQYKQARSEYDEAIATYDKTLVQALREVADTATSQALLVTRLQDARDALTASKEAQVITRQRYEGGLATFLSVLSAEEGLITNQRLVADLESRVLTLDIALVRALGGGFAA